MSDLKQFGQIIDKAPREIERGEITNFVTAQLEAGMRSSTVNRRLATLSRFFEYLADESGDENWLNPVVWRLHRVATGHHLPRDVPERLIRQLWTSISQGPPRDQAIFALMLDVGLRVGEVSNLTLDDVEVADGPDELWSLRLCGKGQKERRVWLTPETAARLADYLDVRPDASDTHLFLTRRHKGISVRGIQERLNHYRQQAGLADDVVSCHRLRHTFARRMAEARMPLPSLSHWLGHSQLKTTQIYINGADPDIRADYEAAMDQLSQHAECPDTATDTPTPEMALSRADIAPTANSEIRLSGDEMRQKLDGMPAWVQDSIVAFLLHQQLRWKAQYRRQRSQQWLGELRRSWQWMLDQRPITEFSALERDDVQAYLSHLYDMEQSPHTINHFINTFKAFLHFVDTTGATISPALYRIQRIKRPPSLPRPLSPQDFARLEQTVLTSDSGDAPSRLLDRTWFLILADSGLRIGELEALLVADWDPDARSLLIRNAKHYRDRRLPVTQRTADALNSYLDHRPDEFGPQDPLLVCHGRPLLAGYVRNHLHDFAAQAQIHGVTPHRLRHTFATRLLNSGLMPITTLQKLMGHTHIDTTMIYVQLYDDTIQQHYLAAMATYSLHDIPEPDPTLWGPTLDHSFDSTLHIHPQLP